MSGHEHQVNRPSQFVLMQAKRLAQQPPRPTAYHRSAHFTAHHQAQPRRAALGQYAPVGDQAAAHAPLAFLPRPGEIAALLDARRAGKAQRFRRPGRHEAQTGVRRLRPSRRRLASVALPLLVELRFKKPCCRLRRIFDGWYWRFINYFAIPPDTASARAARPGKTLRWSERGRISVKPGLSSRAAGFNRGRARSKVGEASGSSSFSFASSSSKKWEFEDEEEDEDEEASRILTLL